MIDVPVRSRIVMDTAKVAWKVLRLSRWVLWLAFLAYCFYLHFFGAAEYNQFGHLPFATEVTIFGLGTAAVFAGLLEMMMRERAGVARPSYGRSKEPAAPLRDRA
jgi:hypothetical protein